MLLLVRVLEAAKGLLDGLLGGFLVVAQAGEGGEEAAVFGRGGEGFGEFGGAVPCLCQGAGVVVGFGGGSG